MSMASLIMLRSPDRLGRKQANKIAFLALRISENTAARSGGDSSFLVLAAVFGANHAVIFVPSFNTRVPEPSAFAVRITAPCALEALALRGFGLSKFSVSSNSRFQYSR